MIRELKICIALVFLSWPGLCPAQDPGVITISVHNYADVPASTLAKAEAEASRIFQKAGISTIWPNCSRNWEPEKIEPANCSLVDKTHLVLKVVQIPIDPQFGAGIDVLGAALVSDNRTSYYAYAYYGRIQKLTKYGRSEYAPLAAVFAHEIGHLLLQSRSHSLSGIMCARWRDDELRQISRGSMYFTSDESRVMRTLVKQLTNQRSSSLSSSNSVGNGHWNNLPVPKIGTSSRASSTATAWITSFLNASVRLTRDISMRRTSQPSCVRWAHPKIV